MFKIYSMKKVPWRLGIALVSALSIVSSAFTPALAAYTRVSGPYLFTAQVDFSQTSGSASIGSIQVRKRSGNFDVPATPANKSLTVEWNTVQLGTDKWVPSDTYLVIFSTLTQAGGVMMYTDNKALNTVTGAPNFVPADGTKFVEGLIDQKTLFASDGSVAIPPTDSKAVQLQPLPLAWSIMDTALVNNHLADFKVQQGLPEGQASITCGNSTLSAAEVKDFLWVPELAAAGNTATAPCFPAFQYMVDISSPTDPLGKTVIGGETRPSKFDGGAAAAIIKDSALGMHQSQGLKTSASSWSQTPSPDYVFFAANFTGALARRTYKARIIIESYTE